MDQDPLRALATKRCCALPSSDAQKQISTIASTSGLPPLPQTPTKLPKRPRRAELPSLDVQHHDSSIKPLAKEKLGQLGHTKGAVTQHENHRPGQPSSKPLRSLWQERINVHSALPLDSYTENYRRIFG
ncbi:hypothetical protein CPAR01_04404 [Colletotrichum paranaense]|uniref:Uncharacterized protein n=1 Tax=Colletotrichum paranaense TaxID=1914294 RepID=A0ABQ9SXS1_9PEZI|nr:uncharacterized protein CPAR01_04404 [Colletotrichum paranaense]KAK1543771.1 hypothetical protein CPAR01_04404 [Colletotrichum paranaense]